MNIAELLKDCPSGMELDCVMFDNVTFVGVNTGQEFPIEIKVGCITKYLTKEGCYHRLDCIPSAKCVIFPKGKTTWEGFQRPFKDGDVVVSEKGDIHLLRTSDSSYCAFRESLKNKLDRSITTAVHVVRFATEEEKQKLFDAIKANGYKWNPETKTLEKFIGPKFKVGDRVKTIYKDYQYDITELTDTHYTLVEVIDKFQHIEPITEDKNWELVPNKFDITTLKPFDKVLVRDSNSSHFWEPKFFFRYEAGSDYPYRMLNYQYFNMCIPYENNEHLLGTTNDCDDFYKTWE